MGPHVLFCADSGAPILETPIFLPSPSSGRELSEFLSGLLYVCQSELTDFFAELTEFALEL